MRVTETLKHEMTALELGGCPILVDCHGVQVGTAGNDPVHPFRWPREACPKCGRKGRLFYNPSGHGHALCGFCYVGASFQEWKKENRT